MTLPKWSYGVTTVPERLNNLFPATLKSLERAGFPNPRVFVDGCAEPKMYVGHSAGGLTLRNPRVRTAGNWVLSLYELFIRDPGCDRYAVFQDDFVTGLNLKKYLDHCKYPKAGYWNLYTFPSNQSLAKNTGWYVSNQCGRGAVALVFDNEAVVTLLSQRHLA